MIPVTRFNDFRPYSSEPNEQNPDWLIENSDLEEIEFWLCTVRAAIKSVSPGKYSFSEWELSFFESVDAQYNSRVQIDDRRPLSGRQLVHLHRLWMRVNNTTMTALERVLGA